MGKKAKSARQILFGTCLTAVFGGVGAAELIGTISRIEGSVYVSADARYVSAPEGTRLKKGDRVFAMENGSAVTGSATVAGTA